MDECNKSKKVPKIHRSKLEDLYWFLGASDLDSSLSLPRLPLHISAVAVPKSNPFLYHVPVTRTVSTAKFLYILDV